MPLELTSRRRRSAWLRSYTDLLSQADRLALSEPERAVRCALEAGELAESHQQPLAQAAALRARVFAFRAQIEPSAAARAAQRAATIYEGHDMRDDALMCRALECLSRSDAGDHGHVWIHAPHLLATSVNVPAARATIGLALALSDLQVGRLLSAWRVLVKVADPAARTAGCGRTRSRVRHVEALVLTAALLQHARLGFGLLEEAVVFPVPPAELMSSALQRLDEAARIADGDGRSAYYQLTRLFAAAMLERDARAVQAIDTLARNAVGVDSALVAQALLSKAQLQHRLGLNMDSLNTCGYLARVQADTGQSGSIAALRLLQWRIHRTLGRNDDALAAMEAYVRLCAMHLKHSDAYHVPDRNIATSHPSAGNVPDLVHNACAFIEARLQTNLLVPDVARHCGVAKRTLETAFRTYKGTTVATYIAERVVARAKTRLQETNWPLLRISQEAGYASIPAFTRAFKAIAGVPPVTWRRGRRNTSGD